MQMTKLRFWLYIGVSYFAGGITVVALLVGLLFYKVAEAEEKAAVVAAAREYAQPDLQQSRTESLKRLRAILDATASDAKVTIGDLTYEWKQAGGTAEITRVRGTEQPMVWYLALADEELKLGVKQADRVEGLKEPPAVWGEDAERIKKMLDGI